MRIAIGGLMHETCTFSTLPTRLSDFRREVGQDLLAGSFWQDLLRQGHDLWPLFVAHALPGGKVTRQAFEALLEELLAGLRRSLPLDGLLLILHGAMEVAEIGDGETAILRAVRDLVGPDVLISTPLDLHANLAPSVVEQSDLVTGYRTAPHRDIAQTRERGMRLLLHCLQGGIRPSSHLIKVPLLVTGEAAVTEVEPSRSLYARLSGIDQQPGVLVSSILIGCAWTDAPYTSVSVVISGTDRDSLQREAEGLAAEIWASREQFAPDSPTAPIEEAIRMAYAAAERPVFVSDSGDNPTGGAAGDTPLILAHLIAVGAEDVLLAGLADAAAVAACFQAGEGTSLPLSLGGKLDAVNAQPFECRATVQRLVPEVAGIAPRVLVRVGQVDVVLQSERWPFTERQQFGTMGLDPAAYKIVVVKEGYLFPELRDYAPRHIMALSPGFGDQRLDKLPYQSLARPIYPLDPQAHWEPGVRPPGS